MTYGKRPHLISKNEWHKSVVRVRFTGSLPSTPVSPHRHSRPYDRSFLKFLCKVCHGHYFGSPSYEGRTRKRKNWHLFLPVQEILESSFFVLFLVFVDLCTFPLLMWNTYSLCASDRYCRLTDVTVLPSFDFNISHHYDTFLWGHVRSFSP